MYVQTIYKIIYILYTNNIYISTYLHVQIFVSIYNIYKWKHQEVVEINIYNCWVIQTFIGDGSWLQSSGFVQAIYRLFTRLTYRVGRTPHHVDSSLLSAWYLSRAWKTYWAREDTSRLLPSGMSMVTRSPILGTSFWARLRAVEMTSMITTAPSPHLSRGVPLRPRLSVVRVLSGEREVSVRSWRELRAGRGDNDDHTGDFWKQKGDFFQRCAILQASGETHGS